MTGKSIIPGAVVLFLLCWSWSASAQDSSRELQVLGRGFRVEIKTSKSTYAVDEPVRVTTVLRNTGNTNLYISKHFSEALGGMAGFFVSVTQLTGKPSKIGCVMAGDPFPRPDSRTAEQVLSEDYLLLPPGALVGFESQYRGCVVKYPGTYQVTAEYWGGFDYNKVRQIADKGDQIVSGKFSSEPTTFRVRKVTR